ncbi:MAG: hypothetical protein A2087_00120 [Spirochaetes bacterium GWD1_61_31]|nr:MAG: hypothetical protein A2Y37_06795 [Spirochaetes bacterium GWB1_60_80]OHD30783.1 MAG: hypothetical protein A2004_04320 [Spirochaetes bacterium GWC1_61_12]OHD42952.1 MAG: hypothetical protein A2087_00120 [Spirochaetes bacterium GWD1_61_31]OHD46282.1 MAG: hypothetical protein A2Y35_07070 [Spirochaetes bacterium GWE1_60_18]OHD60889.1 MAG: hypothetical protein A2Y32_11815 [Spirochaetes bacterium GWF1_60_12]HAP42855.1 hypothetical protein [Spirochaetaceae bacterium]
MSDLESKQRILEAAARIFAEKGFDGARVDEIAKAAQVNKALIYYYFKSKDEILEVLCHETLEHLFAFMAAEQFAKADLSNLPELKAILGQYLDALEEHEQVIRVLLMESLKAAPDRSLVFGLIKETMTRMFASGVATNLSMEQAAQSEVMEFFTGIMPLLNYVVYHNHWMKHFSMTEPELRDMFMDAFIGTHVTYSFRLYGAKGT